MSPVFECDSLDSFFKLIPRVGPDCFTAMSYSFEWQSLLTEMEGDSHPESPLRDVAGQNDRGHSKCYYTGPTQYLPKAPHCVFIHNLDCRLIGGSLCQIRKQICPAMHGDFSNHMLAGSRKQRHGAKYTPEGGYHQKRFRQTIKQTLEKSHLENKQKMSHGLKKPIQVLGFINKTFCVKKSS